MRKILFVIAMPAVLITTLGCFNKTLTTDTDANSNSNTNTKTVERKPMFDAQVGYKKIELSIPNRRISISAPLRIVINPTMKDTVTVTPTPDIREVFTDYRKVMGDLLLSTFSQNFSDIAVAQAESKQGLELILMMADMQQTTTIKYQVVLTQNGKEVIDFVGESAGKTIAMKGNINDNIAAFPSILEELYDFTQKSMAENIYNSVMRNEKLDTQGFWDKLSK